MSVTIKNKIAFTEVVKGSSISKAMRKAGYAESTSKRTNKLTNTSGWQELMATYMPEKVFANAHKELLNNKQLAYFIFPKTMKDKEIEQAMVSNGLDLIVIQESMKGRMAFYSVMDANARKNALDMFYKLKGLYKNEDKDKVDPFAALKAVYMIAERIVEKQNKEKKIIELQ
jgi:hypothetical protein